ncbi:hypothetical protein PYCC9005_005265 [Savitreella phatthalungensis]
MATAAMCCKPPAPRRAAFVIIFIVIVLWLLDPIAIWPTTMQPDTSSSKSLGAPTGSTSQIPQTPAPQAPKLDIDFSIDDESWELGIPFSLDALRETCEDVPVWHEGMWLNMFENSGGLGNQRNFFLTGLRYGIAAGFTGIVLPKLRKRSDTDLVDLFSGEQEFDHMFDSGHLIRTLAAACPRIKVVMSVEEIPNHKHAVVRKDLTPQHLANHMTHEDMSGIIPGNYWANRFNDDFMYWMDDELKSRPSVNRPFIISWPWANFFNWPVYAGDYLEFANSFGRLLRIRQDARDLAQVVLREMAHQHPALFGKAPDEPATSPLLSYHALHLRTEYDRLQWWKSAEEVRAAAAEWVGRSEARLVYVACGDPQQIPIFNASIRDLPEKPVLITKDLILRSANASQEAVEALKLLESMTWDEQALVDYLVMLRCHRFWGISYSTFSGAVALYRRMLKKGLRTLRWPQRSDRYSELWGIYGSYHGHWLHFYDHSWA